jgi:hypothetical protein
MTFELISAVNNNNVLKQNLLSSPCVRDGMKVQLLRGYQSASEAYENGRREAENDILLFAHQDVYLPHGWLSRVKRNIELLESENIPWGVLGVIGKTSEDITVGTCWSNGKGKALGTRIHEPVEVVSVDELVIIIKRQTNIAFDVSLPGFHLYGTDIVQSALKAGYGAFVIYAPVIHNSLPVIDLDKSYYAGYRYLRHKLMKFLPVYTTVIPITKWSVPLWRFRIRRVKWQLKNTYRLLDTVKRHSNPGVLATDLGYDSLNEI